MPYTSNKRYSVQSVASNPGTWGATGTNGDDLNTGVMGLIDTQLAGLATFSVSSSNVTLSYANVQSCAFRFTGTLLASIVASPDASGSPVAATYFNGFYYFENLTSGSFTITLTTGAGSVVLPQSRRGIVFVDSVNGPRIFAIAGSAAADPIPVGTVMIFYQNAAPTGWTISSALNDYALKIVSSAGGVTSGSVAYSTLFGRTATDSHTLTLPEIPSHTHTVGNQGSLVSNFTSSTSYASPGSGSTGAAGGGGGHTHDIDMRVQTASVILATKA